MKTINLRELASRENDGVEVSLFWNPAGNDVFVLVSDEKTGDRFEIAVGSRSALDVFHHPYAYASTLRAA
jgi:hypothetical protein